MRWLMRWLMMRWLMRYCAIDPDYRWMIWDGWWWDGWWDIVLSILITGEWDEMDNEMVDNEMVDEILCYWSWLQVNDMRWLIMRWLMVRWLMRYCAIDPDYRWMIWDGWWDGWWWDGWWDIVLSILITGEWDEMVDNEMVDDEMVDEILCYWSWL